MTAWGKPVASSAHVRKVARNPWAVIGRLLEISIHFAAVPPFIRLSRVSIAMFDNGRSERCDGKTNAEV
jgi:hypothetical protein